MNTQHISALLAFILLSCCTFTKANPNEELLQVINCVSKSGDQQLCDQFLECNDKMAEPFLTAYNECIRVILPNGIGSCDENTELYYSERNRRLINRCIYCKVAGKELTDEDKQQMDEFQQCVHTLGEKAGCQSSEENSK
ncbi:hypothetical protein HNY73_002835 [Argiope bruennichi]|uniref:Uncharacterized protein n=1 Tax=Argiope bruennichi TaxID=94029 RepID=A0A8T0FV03_ARGBR|nr:hypothetical protein HNY73_002835 [Argiope bruennichi]